MNRKKTVGLLGAGVLFVLAFASAACSGQTPTATAPLGSEVLTYRLTVYESPT